VSAGATLAMWSAQQGQGQPSLGDLFPGLDLSSQQAQQALIAGMVAGGIAVAGEDQFAWNAFWWGSLSTTAAFLAAVGVNALVRKEKGYHGR
jgi:hypothetical protein